MPKSLTARDAALLGRIFEAEIAHGLPASIHSKRTPSLVERQLIIPVTMTTAASDDCPFPVEVSGYMLTVRGNYLYCEWASRQPDPIGAK